MLRIVTVNGPWAEDHDQHPVSSIQPMTVTIRSTKAEILAHAMALQAQINDGPDWSAVGRKLSTTAARVWRETLALVKDCYAAGQWARRCYDHVVAELSRPIFKR